MQFKPKETHKSQYRSSLVGGVHERRWLKAERRDRRPTTGCLYLWGLRAPPDPPRGLPSPPRVVYIHKGIHPFTGALNPTDISTWNPHLTTRAPHLIPSLVVCIHAGETRHHGLCVFDLWISSDVKRDQTFQSETDIELDMEQNITRHSFISITKRLFITPEDRAVPAFILVTSSASVSTTYCTTAPWPWSTSLLTSR